MMVRNGATDNVLQYLSSSDVLRLKNVAAGQWEGVLYTVLPYATLNHRVQATMRPRIFSITPDTSIRAYVPTAI